MKNLHNEVKSWFPEIRIIVDHFFQKGFNKKEKANYRDLVSEVDIEVQGFITKKINELCQNNTILVEESENHNVDLNSKKLWCIDPIDGTANMIKQREEFGVLIAYFESGLPKLSYIYDVSRNRLFYAIDGKGAYLDDKEISVTNHNIDDSLISTDSQFMKDTEILKYINENAFGTRFLGATSADTMRVINDQYGGVINPACGPWDRAPLILFAKELKIKICQLDGRPTTLRGVESYYFGSKSVYDEIKNNL